MSKNHDSPSFFRRLFSTSNQTTDKKGDKKPPKIAYMGVLLAAGVAIMLISNLTLLNEPAAPSGGTIQVNSSEEAPAFSQKKAPQSSSMADYEAHYESQLKDVLQAIVGVDDVEVIVNLDATESKVYEKNSVSQSQTTEETDREGGTRKVQDSSTDEQLVIVRNDNQEKPVVVKTKKPEIRGVLVVAKGANNIEVKKWIIEAVTRVLDVPSHRVAVLPKKSKGE
ncbi:stage III sporulation protein AG [Metabacillus iocasae]|uniref:Stage III sporulation protein AG n=1 Tax=Priestia iocasae TaxID=2291674 RepID=A0ABS2QQ39_9BACI|nr:stage III sporulation protein AG [Metabacillus iocasae]MBM7701580.1 stage III sporulation protein AG [Metabacillus iocasae]